MLDYFDLYQKLYEIGYQNEDNIGLDHVKQIVLGYKFNSILDIGCAQGKAVEAYRKVGKDAYGIDVAQGAIADCKKKGLNCKVASVLNIPYPENRFDAVITTDVLEHLKEEDVDQAIKEIIRVAKKYIFVRVAKSLEKRKDWVEKIKDKHKEYKDLENLHLTVYPRKYWGEKFISYPNIKFLGKSNRILIFEKLLITNI
jgi:ubiquinone/menaquinone biosynthesis C-methylase UbiE